MLTMSLILAGALAAQAPAKTPTADDYAGRWNLKITDADDTFVSGGFQITTRAASSPAGSSGAGAATSRRRRRGQGRRAAHRPRGGRREARQAGHLRGAPRGRDAEGQGHLPRRQRATSRARGRPCCSEEGPGWDAPVTLFDGKTLAGWKLRDTKKKNGWAVVDGELAVVEPKDNADLVSEQTFQDMKLHVEFNVDAEVQQRRLPPRPVRDPDPRQPRREDGRSTPTAAARSTAAWRRRWTRRSRPASGRRYDIEIVGRQVSVALNGKKVVQGVVDGITGRRAQPVRGRARAADAAGRPRQGPLPQHRGHPRPVAGAVASADVAKESTMTDIGRRRFVQGALGTTAFLALPGRLAGARPRAAAAAGGPPRPLPADHPGLPAHPPRRRLEPRPVAPRARRHRARTSALMEKAGCNTFSVGIFAWADARARGGALRVRLARRHHERPRRSAASTPSSRRRAGRSRAGCRRSTRRCGASTRRAGASCTARATTTASPRPSTARRCGSSTRSSPSATRATRRSRGWHISNEYSGACYCSYCLAAFRAWLKTRYADARRAQPGVLGGVLEPDVPVVGPDRPARGADRRAATSTGTAS